MLVLSPHYIPVVLQAQSAVCVGGVGTVYFTINLELLPSTRPRPHHKLGPLALDQTCLCAFSVFQTKSPRTPVVQDLEELGPLREEAAGGDEDREKEMLMERIQSIKEEKQVSCAPSPPLSRRALQAGTALGTALQPSCLQGWGPRCQGHHLLLVLGVREGPRGAGLLPLGVISWRE